MRVLVYDDNSDFGGHQIMALRGIEALAAEEGIELTRAVNPSNKKLWRALPALPTVVAGPERVTELKPDLVLCVQGDIAQSTTGVAAARAAGVPCVSYLALPHTLAQMGAKFGAARDALHRKWLNKPDRYVTISEEMKRILRGRGVKKPIAIVPNGIPAPPIPKIMKRGQTTTIGVVGRVEFTQKRQDYMVDAFLSQPSAFENCHLLFVGGGPDEYKLDKMIEGSGVISHHPWTDDIEALYARVDVLAIPSRFEGVPLVMLEALARGIPVIGSDRDGMKESLPSDWLFDPDDPVALANAFAATRQTWRDRITELQRKTLTDHALDAFRVNFVNAVLGA